MHVCITSSTIIVSIYDILNAIDVIFTIFSIEKGKPTPRVTWGFKSVRSDYFSDIPPEMTVSGSKVEISSLKNEHGGIYKCEATNMIGHASRDITVHVQCK